MTKSEWTVDLRRGDAFEWGALLLTVLAFPEPEPPEALMESCYYSLCARALRDNLSHPERAYLKHAMKPVYAFRDTDRIHRDWRHVKKRLAHRMLAAKMVMPFLREALTGESPVLQLGIERLSMARMSEIVISESPENDPKNLASRIWRPSRRVIHLAAAIGFVSQALERGGYGPLTAYRMLSDSSVLDLILRNAEDMVPLLDKSRARVDVDSLIRLRVA